MLLSTTEDVAALVALIRDGGRTEPVLVVTTRNRETEPLFDTAALASMVAPLPVRVVPTGELTWELTALLPPDMGVFGGAARIWWPGYADGDPVRSHPLFFAYSQAEAGGATRRVVGDLAARGYVDASFVTVAPQRTAPMEGQAVEGAVSAVLYHGAEVQLDDGRAAYVPTTMITNPVPSHPREVLAVGDAVVGWLTGASKDARVELDLRTYDELPPVLQIGTVVASKVLEAYPGGAEVDLGQGLHGWWTIRKRDPAVRVGDTINVLFKARDGSRAVLEAPPRGATVSAPVAASAAVLPGPSRPRPVAPSVRSDDKSAFESLLGERRKVAELDERVLQLREQLDASEADRNEAIKSFSGRLQEARREIRSLTSRNEWLAAQRDGLGTHIDPAEQFRHEVQHAWTQNYAPSDRDDWPIRPYTLGIDFLASVKGLQGIERRKIVDVCVDVVTFRAATIHTRELHELRESEAGESPVRVRRDGARAWRVYMQQKTASARRLHYWQLLNGTIELANVSVHDDVNIR